MKRKFSSAIAALMLLLLLSCGTSTSTRTMTPVERQATDVPERFEDAPGINRTSNACVSPLIDPRDGTTIRMQSSFGAEEVGDYIVPQGKYGVEENELLRINCRTGEVIGIVRK